MVKQMIEIEVPDGYKITSAPKIISIPESIGDIAIDVRLYLKKDQPKRRVFEETGEFRFPKYGEWYECGERILRSTHNHGDGAFKILKEITEE